MRSQREPASAILGTVWSLYYREGYDEGYRRAIDDMLAALLSISEEFISGHSDKAEELRRVLYPFEHHLEQKINQMSPDEGVFEGGMGI